MKRVPDPKAAFRFAAGAGLLCAFASWPWLPANPPAEARTVSAGHDGVPATSADRFLSSLGVNLHVDQGYDPASYVEPLKFTGIRQARDGMRNAPGELMLRQKTGVRFSIVTGGDIQLESVLEAVTILAKADALLAVEGPNEPNNFPITYKGVRGGGHDESWMSIATFQSDLYRRVKNDAVLKDFPVFAPSETGAEADNVGLQFLTVPAGAGTKVPDRTRFADYANVHNYVSGNGSSYGDNQAWNAADPTLQGHWDGLYGNNGVTWHRHFKGYSNEQLRTLPRVTTETGWDTKFNPGGQTAQGSVLVNTYLAQFKRGWRYSFIYEMRDGEGGAGAQGLYHGNQPKLAASYIHNLTTILSDHAPLGKPGRLAYAIPDKPETVHDLLLQKSNGTFELAVWGERVQGTDSVHLDLGRTYRTVNVYDVTKGTTPISVLARARRIPLTLSDHALIIEPRN
jgi:hypothetical protein